MRPCLLWALALLFAPMPGHAAWARVPVVQLKHHFSSLDFADISGTRTIVVSSHLGALETIQWNQGAWLSAGRLLPFEKTRVWATLEGDPGKSDRLFLASAARPEILQWTLGPRGQTSVAIELPGYGTDSLSAWRSINDGSAHIFVTREFKGIRTSSISQEIRIKPYECQEGGKGWSCAEIQGECSGPFILNPPWGVKTDTLLGCGAVLLRSSGTWKAVGKGQSFWGIVAPSNQRERIVYSNEVDYAFGPGFRYVERRDIPPIGTRIRSIAIGDIRGDGKERVYRGATNGHVYEFTFDKGTWTVSDMGSSPGSPALMSIGDLRGDGKERLYVLEQEGSDFTPSKLMELAFYPTVSTAVVFDFHLSDSTSTPERRRNLETVLGNVFRSELASFGHIAVLDQDSADKAAAERKFQSSQCGDEACLLRIGRTAAARSSLVGTVAKTQDGYGVTVRMFDNETGRLAFRRNRLRLAEDEVLAAMKTMAWEVGRNWPTEWPGR